MQLKTKSNNSDDRFDIYDDNWWEHQMELAPKNNRARYKSERKEHSSDYEARAEQAVNRW